MYRLKSGIISLLLAVLFIISCKNNDKKQQRGPVVREEKPVTKVDVTIDTTNSFNTLFIDSSVVGHYITQHHIGDTLGNRMRSFYNSRNYQYAWFSGEGMPEHTISFWNMIKNYLNYSKDSSLYNKAVYVKMEKLVQDDSLVPKNNADYQQLELNLTRLLYLFADHNYAYDPNFDMKSLEWYIPRKKMTANDMLNNVIEKKGAYAEANAPINSQYKKLREQLLKYKEISDAGGWPTVHNQLDVLKKGYKGPEIRDLKKRLQIEGFLDGGDSSFSNVFDASLADAVNAAKKEYGYKPDGSAGTTFINDLNIPVDERIQQILINMERMRWIPVETRDSGRAIMVNIPEFILHVYENGRPAWNMNVVVGKEGNNTVVFTGNLKTIVFSPYWNVPTSIVRKEMHGRPSAGYLARNHMEIVNGQVRQKPGPWNSLGLVKFLFPNSYNIYFHDTPSKSLFNKDKRSFSHGCIRLKEPARLAEYLLADTAKWNRQKIDSFMHLGKEKYIPIKKPIPVLITYFTSWVDDEGQLNFREDIYGHDEIVARKMFLNSKATTRASKKKFTGIKKDSTGTKPVLVKKDSLSKKPDTIKKHDAVPKKDSGLQKPHVAVKDSAE